MFTSRLGLPVRLSIERSIEGAIIPSGFITLEHPGAPFPKPDVPTLVLRKSSLGDDYEYKIKIHIDVVCLLGLI